jgi:hypothetical protein
MGKKTFVVLFVTRRGLTLLLRNFLAALGLLSGIVQLQIALSPGEKVNFGLVLGALLGVAAVYTLLRSWPRSLVRRNFERPDIAITVKVGDLFDEKSHLVVGFNDVFDTDVTDNVIISPTSVQGQFLQRIYSSATAWLDNELDTALSDEPVAATEVRTEKRHGKLSRYKIGTVAVLGTSAQRYFCVAYSRMGNNLIAKSDVENLWSGLSSLWDAIFLQGHREPVATPIIGSDLARINNMDRESLLRMILLSFVARSRQEIVCRELVIVIHPKDYRHINMLEVEAFIKTL